MTQFAIHALGDDGQRYVLHVRQNPIDTDDFAGSESIPGHFVLRTEDGRTVSYLEKGRYQILASGVIVTSTDLHAP